jgi:hypothetical protein
MRPQHLRKQTKPKIIPRETQTQLRKLVGTLRQRSINNKLGKRHAKLN